MKYSVILVKMLELPLDDRWLFESHI
jgi:hypothetical protein